MRAPGNVHFSILVFKEYLLFSKEKENLKKKKEKKTKKN